MMQQPANIVIFTGEKYLSSHLLLSQVVPKLIKMGLKPQIWSLAHPDIKRASLPTLKHMSFYDGGIVNEDIHDFLRQSHVQRNGALPIQLLAEKHNVPFYRSNGANDTDMLEQLEQQDFIGCLSLHNPSIFNANSIARLKAKGFLWNVHRGLLPEMRGLYLPFWSLVEKRPTHGCTLHEVDTGIDTGDVIATYEIETALEHPVIYSYADLIDGCVAMVTSAVASYLGNGYVETTKQDTTKARYYSFPTEEDIAKARAQGIRLWGTPLEMLSLYRRLFGEDEELTMRLINAIAEFERGAEEEAIPATVPAARDTEAA